MTRGGKRPGAGGGKPTLPDSEKVKKIGITVKPDIWKFLQVRKAAGYSIARTIDEAIRGWFKI